MRRKRLLHSISLGLVLFGVWLLLSGFFEPLLLGLGVLSCVIVVLIAHRMDVIDREGVPIHLGWRILAYWVWLAVEIVKASLDVARRILDPKLPIHPLLVRVKASQASELASGTKKIPQSRNSAGAGPAWPRLASSVTRAAPMYGAQGLQ